MSGDHETYEWYTTPYGDFRVEQKRFGTWTSYSKDGNGAHHLTHEGSLYFRNEISPGRCRY